MSKKIILFTLVLLLFGCSSKSSLEVKYIGTSRSNENLNIFSNFNGWDYIAKKLISDGIDSKLVKQVYLNDKINPKFDIIPFKLRPKETSEMYKGFRTKKVKKIAQDCYLKYQNLFDQASVKFKVKPEVLVSFLTIETYCGKTFGDEYIINRLSRVSSVLSPGNVEQNLKLIRNEFPGATIKDVKLRGEYLENVFYPQVLSLFELHQNGQLDIFTLKGSIAGAFGMPQFLPKTYMDYGFDGDLDGNIDLFNPADAIYSVGNFLKSYGWNNELSNKKKREIIWHYNRSEPYIDTIVYLSNL